MQTRAAGHLSEAGRSKPEDFVTCSGPVDGATAHGTWLGARVEGGGRDLVRTKTLACLADESQLGVLCDVVLGIHGITGFEDRYSAGDKESPEGSSPRPCFTDESDGLQYPLLVCRRHSYTLPVALTVRQRVR